MSTQRITSLNDREVKEYEVYKLIILFFALIDQLYVQVFSAVTVGFVTFFEPLVEPLARIIRLWDSFITYDTLYPTKIKVFSIKESVCQGGG